MFVDHWSLGGYVYSRRPKGQYVLGNITIVKDARICVRAERSGVCGFNVVEWVCGFNVVEWVCGINVVEWVCSFNVVEWVCGINVVEWCVRF